MVVCMGSDPSILRLAMTALFENVARVFASLVALQDQVAIEKETLLRQDVDVGAVLMSLHSLLHTLDQQFDPRRIRLHGSGGHLQPLESSQRIANLKQSVAYQKRKRTEAEETLHCELHSKISGRIQAMWSA